MAKNKKTVNFLALLDVYAEVGTYASYAQVEAWLVKKGFSYSMPRNAEGPIILKIDLEDLRTNG